MNMSGFPKTSNKKKDFDDSVQGLGTSCHSLFILTLYACRAKIVCLFIILGSGGEGERERERQREGEGERERERERERRHGVRKTEIAPAQAQDCVVCRTEDPRDQRLPASLVP